MNDLVPVACDLQAFCDAQGWQSWVIGGIAIQRWGQVRVTRDVDISLLTGLGNEDEFCRVLLGKYRARISDPVPFARKTRVLLLYGADGSGIDVSLAAMPVEERMHWASLHEFAPGLSLRICSAEDLIVLKLFASRPLDIRDAETVAIRHSKTLDWQRIEEELTPLAELKEESEIFDQLRRIRQL